MEITPHDEDGRGGESHELGRQKGVDNSVVARALRGVRTLLAALVDGLQRVPGGVGREPEQDEWDRGNLEIEATESAGALVTTHDESAAEQSAPVTGEQRPRSADQLFTEPPDTGRSRPVLVGRVENGQLTVREPGDSEAAIESDVWQRAER